MAEYLAQGAQLRKANGLSVDFGGVWDSYNGARFRNWVYVISCKPWRVQPLQVDPTTASLTVKEALELANPQPLALIYVASRSLADGSGALYMFFSTHEQPSETTLYWFRLDAKTGAASLGGKLALPGKDHTHWVMAPKGSHLYALTEGGKLTTYRFAADGAPEEAGACNVAKGLDRGATGIFSPDGRQLYVAANANKDFPGGRIDVFQCDAATGKPAYESTLSLPTFAGTEKGCGLKLAGVRPDGKYVYVAATSGTNQGVLHVLPRDATNGALTIPSKSPTDFATGGITDFQFRPDGSSGFYFENGRFVWFACDAQSGALSVSAKSDKGFRNLRHMELDREHKNLILLSADGADSFKVKGSW
jgi:6-phosphogluconolactonase (cycloisomerase 2 family)